MKQRERFLFFGIAVLTLYLVFYIASLIIWYINPELSRSGTEIKSESLETPTKQETAQSYLDQLLDKHLEWVAANDRDMTKNEARNIKREVCKNVAEVYLHKFRHGSKKPLDDLLSMIFFLEHGDLDLKDIGTNVQELKRLLCQKSQDCLII
jgi:hypothetical protein